MYDKVFVLLEKTENSIIRGKMNTFIRSILRAPLFPLLRMHFQDWYRELKTYEKIINYYNKEKKCYIYSNYRKTKINKLSDNIKNDLKYKKIKYNILRFDFHDNKNGERKKELSDAINSLNNIYSDLIVDLVIFELFLKTYLKSRIKYMFSLILSIAAILISIFYNG